MSASEEINAKLDWLIESMKYLLANQAPQPEPDDDAWLDDSTDFDAELAAAAAQVVTGSGCGHALTAIRGGHVTCTQCGEDLGCAHNQQAVVSGRVVCASCGALLGRSGVVGRDANAPIPGQRPAAPRRRTPAPRSSPTTSVQIRLSSQVRSLDLYVQIVYSGPVSRELHELWGRNMRTYREAAGLTRREAAEKLNTSTTNLGRWETAAVMPSDAKKIEIALCYGVLPSTVFPWTEVPA